MDDPLNRASRLRRRPSGRLIERDLELVEEAVPEPVDGQALHTRYLSLGSTNRIWMGEAPSYIPPVPLDAVMRGVGVAEVIASRRDDLKVGDLVSGSTGWQEYAGSCWSGSGEKISCPPVGTPGRRTIELM